MEFKPENYKALYELVEFYYKDLLNLMYHKDKSISELGKESLASYERTKKELIRSFELTDLKEQNIALEKRIKELEEANQFSESRNHTTPYTNIEDIIKYRPIFENEYPNLNFKLNSTGFYLSNDTIDYFDAFVAGAKSLDSLSFPAKDLDIRKAFEGYMASLNCLKNLTTTTNDYSIIYQDKYIHQLYLYFRGGRDVISTRKNLQQ